MTCDVFQLCQINELQISWRRLTNYVRAM